MARTRAEDLVELVSGEEAVARHFVHLCGTAREEVLFRRARRTRWDRPTRP